MVKWEQTKIIQIKKLQSCKKSNLLIFWKVLTMEHCTFSMIKEQYLCYHYELFVTCMISSIWRQDKNERKRGRYRDTIMEERSLRSMKMRLLDAR